MDYTQLTIDNGIGTLSFFTEKSNSLPSSILGELKEKIEYASKSDEIKVILLKSEGEKTFCAGASFDELIQISNEESGKDFFMGFANVIHAIRKSTKLVIGRVQGKTIGGGVGLAAACDYCFATENASIKLSELSIGIGPFVIAEAVKRKIGLSAFSSLSINSTEFYNAQWAAERGLYADIYPSAEAMDQAIIQLTTNLSKSSSEAMKELKRLFWEGTNSWDEVLNEKAMISGKLVNGEFAQNLIGQFKKKN